MLTPSDIRLIAFDLDGTLLTEEKKLTPRTRDILERLSAQGILLMTTTGRALAGIPDDVKALSGAKYALTSNGAGVYHRKDDGSYELVLENLMNHERAIELIGELSAFEVMPDPFIDGACYMLKEKAYLIDKMDVSDAMKDYIRMSRTQVADMKTFLQDKQVQKITINFAVGEDGHRIDLEPVWRVLKRYPEFVAVTGGIQNIEISDTKATKGDAMMALAGQLGIRAEQILAFGDSENDNTMLQMAGTGVAMANALDITKEVADEITLSNEEDGVAVWLENHFS